MSLVPILEQAPLDGPANMGNMPSDATAILAPLTAAGGPPPEFAQLVAQLHQLEEGIEADRRVRHDALNRLALLERTLHSLEVISQKIGRPNETGATAAPSPDDSSPDELPEIVEIPRAKAAAAVFTATLQAVEESASPAVARAPIEAPRAAIVEWLEWLEGEVGPYWAGQLVDHYHRIGWLDAPDFEALSELAQRMPTEGPRHVSMQAMYKIHEETRTRLGVPHIISE